MKVTIIEDERDLAELLAYNLEKEGWQTTIAMDGKRGLELVREELPDLVILDLMLPEMNGLDVCRHLRKNRETAAIPIIMVTAKGDEIDRVVGFEVGADDYLVKPYSTGELRMRIKAVLRRTRPHLQEERVLSFGMLTIDTVRHLITVNNQTVNLTATEFKLLLTLAERRGRMQSRDQLLTEVWDYGNSSDSRTVDTHITRLRNKLGAAGEMIHTVRGYGYKLESP